MINLPDDAYLVNLGYAKATITIKRERANLNPAIPTNVMFPNESYILGDRWGRFNYSQIVIRFDHLLPIKYHVMLSDYVLELSVRAINRVLRVCRAVKGDHYITINLSDIFSYDVQFLSGDGSAISGSVFGLANNNVITVGGAGEANSSQVDMIKRVLENNSRLTVCQELMLNAYDYHYYGNYRMSVIESGTAFEVFVEKFLADTYRNLGKDDKKISDILEAGLANLLKDHIKIVTGLDFHSSAQHKEWEKHAYRVRNDVIHRGKNVSAQESKITLETNASTIKYIFSLKGRK